MVNYQNGKIYEITSDQTPKRYIGSTAKKYLCDRLSCHKFQYRKYLRLGNKKYYCSSAEILKYNDAKIVLLEGFPCNSKDELYAREEEWRQANLDTCVNRKTAFGIDLMKRKANDTVIILCDCGASIQKTEKPRHAKTQKHKKWEESKKIKI
jgi:hypothetical protein